MAEKRYKLTRTREIEGFQHAKDDYWMQPLVFGKNIFTYKASVPPGGFMPPHDDGGHENELSFYMLQGELEMTIDREVFKAVPGDAIHIHPMAALGVNNRGKTVASFLLTFYPSPTGAFSSLEAMRKRWAEKAPQSVKSAAEMEALAKK
ncbi:MAG TPA: cupin domain-containing protein [Bacillota bacterium]|nr:cupin domain-containing protein [Bacillota bacterium]